MRDPILAVTGDTHGEHNRFYYPDEPCNRHLQKGDFLFVCGDFGYLMSGKTEEHLFLRFLAQELPYTICFCDGNHENFDLLEACEETGWMGGKVHILGRDREGTPKIIHLMRGQIYEICGKKIFAFGGAYSHDKVNRVPGVSWWSREMPGEEEKQEALRNLEAVGWKVDYILTHTAPEETIAKYHRDHLKEEPLNLFLEFIREKTEYQQWYIGHLHQDREEWRNQTLVLFSLWNMETHTELK